MLTKEQRMAKLNNAGINTGKFFTVEIEGKKVNLTFDASGNPVVVQDTVETQIIEDGYVRNTKLHRRFVMAQMFHALNYRSYDGRREGYNEWLKARGFKYSFDMMLEEVRVLGKLEERDRDTFLERSHFFTKMVVIGVMEDYVLKLKEYVDGLPVKKCKGIPYKRIKGVDVFVEDLKKKVYAQFEREIYIASRALTYNEIYRSLKKFMRNMIQLPADTPKSKLWIDAYKGEGSFYTLKNLCMFHDCFVEDAQTGEIYFGVNAINYLEYVLGVYHGEGWRMFALLKHTIEVNKFDFQARMQEIYND